MNGTAIKLIKNIMAHLGTVRDCADALVGDPGIAGAECILHLRDCQEAANKAYQSLCLVISQANDKQTK